MIANSSPTLEAALGHGMVQIFSGITHFGMYFHRKCVTKYLATDVNLLRGGSTGYLSRTLVII